MPVEFFEFWDTRPTTVPTSPPTDAHCVLIYSERYNDCIWGAISIRAFLPWRTFEYVTLDRQCLSCRPASFAPWPPQFLLIGAPIHERYRPICTTDHQENVICTHLLANPYITQYFMPWWHAYQYEWPDLMVHERRSNLRPAPSLFLSNQLNNKF